MIRNFAEYPGILWIPNIKLLKDKLFITPKPRLLKTFAQLKLEKK